MGMYDWIQKKKMGLELTNDEINLIIKGYMDESIPDYQMSAMLMAICLKGMSEEEVANLTIAMARSGDTLDLSPIKGFKIDKHSTGGVGDKTTLVVAPVVAACGVKVAKMSGRGLGFTGGTIDKLESIPGFRTDLKREEFIRIVNRIGVGVIGQSVDLAPADKKIYALRDVTATVDSIPLITASIMSKKLASGNDGIVLDVTVGSGAFMKKLEDAVLLAKAMVGVGKRFGKDTVALITNMDVPLGNAIGNRLEVLEAVWALQGKGPKDLMEVCRHLATDMLVVAKKGDREECWRMADDVIQDGSAFETFCQMVGAQGGNVDCIRNTDLLNEAPYQVELKAEEEGTIIRMDTGEVGMVSVTLGAGRVVKEDEIDPLAGVILYKKTGDEVKRGDVLAVLHASDEEKLEPARKRLRRCYSVGKQNGESSRERRMESLILKRL